MSSSCLRTIVYVDGFNLYYRALRRTPYRWLNLQALSQALLSPENHIDRIRYFTAPVSGKQDPGQPTRQQIYLRALQTLPNCSIHFGSFLTRIKTRPLADPSPGGPTHVRVLDSEEKGSDVNLATHLLNDAWKDLFDVALIMSQDSDLLEPLRIVKEERGKNIGLVCLDGKAPGKLAQYSTFIRHITPERLAAAQFPETLILAKPGKELRRPERWE
jgi:uncharacterized LabA/DUF88 family protein